MIQYGDRFQMIPATVVLTEEQIKWAIDAYVSSEGYKVGKGTLAVNRGGQFNGPDEFLATVEVTPQPKPIDSAYNQR